MDYKALTEFYHHLDRSYFIDTDMKVFADLDKPLSIGYEQTISQPSLVLEMTLLLSPDQTSSVLEIGTGSGYQTALLAQFSKQVYTIERIPELGQKARKRLEALGYNNIAYRIGDGSEGWRAHAPYDRIMVTAAAAELPLELVDQLQVGGRMIIPLGPPEVQELQLIIKDSDGMIQCHSIEKVRFVEMRGKYGWSAQEN